MTNNKKIFIIDTSVLLYDKHAIHSFPGNILLIPIVVLDELDRFKDKKGLIGENARYVNRYLDDLRSKGSLHDGIEIEDDQIIKVALEGFEEVPGGLDENYADNRIIALALHEKKHHANNHKIILVTKDINFRVKCDALGINSEDYRKDKIELRDNEAYKGYSDFELEDPFVIDQFYAIEKNKNSESYDLMVEQMTDEVKYSEYSEDGIPTETVDLNTFIRLFVNHRPVYGIGKNNIEEAFKSLCNESGNDQYINKGKYKYSTI